MAVKQLANLVPKVPTAEDAVKKLMRQAGVPYKGTNRRGRRRITVQELNRLGVEGLGLTKEDIRPKDRRSAVTKVFDWLDLPRNVVAQAVGALAGVDASKAQKGALGLRRVYMSDVLKKLGVKNKAAQAVIGFAGDVLIDPLTYLSLGASTGTQIAKHVPKVLPPGMKSLRQLAQGMVSGGRISKAVAKTFGRTPEQLRRLGAFMAKRYGPDAALKKLMQKRGGVLTRSLASRVLDPRRAKQARAFFTKFGEQGRTLLRLPFAASGMTLKKGKRAALYQAMGKPDKTLKFIGKRMGTVRRMTRKIARQIPEEFRELAEQYLEEAQRRAGKPFSAKKRAQVIRQFFEKGWKARNIQAPGLRRLVRKNIGKQYELRKIALAQAKAAASSPEATLPFTLAHAAKYGKTRIPALDTIPFLGRVRRFIFGPGASEAGRVAAGAKHAMQSGAQVAKQQVAVEFTKMLRPVVDDVSRASGRSADEVMGYLFDLMEKGGKYHPADPVQARIAEAMQLVGQRDDVAKALAEAKEYLKQTRARLVKAGVEPGEIKGYMARVSDPEFAKATGSRAMREGQLPVTSPRTKLLEYDVVGQGKVRILSTSKKERAAYDAMVKAKKATVEQYDISTELWNQLAAGTAPPEFVQPGGKALGASQIPEGYAGARFGKDIPESLGAVASEAERRLGAGTVADVAAGAGVKVPMGEEAGRKAFSHLVDYDSWASRTFLGRKAISSTPFHTFAGHKLKGLALPQPVLDMVEDAARVTTSSPELEAVLKASDTYMRVWKVLALMSPAYTVRNIVENTFGMAREGINPLRALRRVPELRKIVRRAAAGESLEGLFLVIRGRKIPAEAFVKSAKLYNMMNAGMTSMLIEPTLWAKAKSALPRLGRRWFDYNNRIENVMRLSAMAQLMDEGLSARQAALKTIRSMPDLTDLTQFDQQFMRRIFPFWSWMRKNGANVARLFVQRPAVVAGTEKFRRYAEMAIQGDNVVDPALRPEWQQEMQAMQVAGDKNRGTVFLLGGWLPFDELIDTLAATQSFSHFTNAMLSKVRPDAKFLLEMGTGTDIFKQRPVEPFTTPELLGAVPKSFVGRSATPVDNLLSIRPLREVTRIAEMPTAAAGAARIFIGGALQPITKDRALVARYKSIKDEMQKVRSGINRAQAVNHESEVARLTKRWFSLSRELEELGLPGTAAPTRKTLRKLGVKAGEPALGRR